MLYWLIKWHELSVKSNPMQRTLSKSSSECLQSKTSQTKKVKSNHYYYHHHHPLLKQSCSDIHQKCQQICFHACALRQTLLTTLQRLQGTQRGTEVHSESEQQQHKLKSKQRILLIWEFDLHQIHFDSNCSWNCECCR